MGRLINADKAIKDMQYYHDDCAQTSEYTKLGFETAMEVVKSASTVEAIPKADYETRLKADMVAILVEIQLEIEEIQSSQDCCDYATDNCVSRYNITDLIQQKIDKLKGETI